MLYAQQSSSGKLELIWVKYGREGEAYATCASSSMVYVVGVSKDKGVVEARDINTGDIIAKWEAESVTELYDCILLGDYLYVVGSDNVPGNYEWLILKFTLDLKLVVKRQYNPSKNDEGARTVFTDGKYLYVGGYDSSKATVWDLYTDTQWLLLQLDPSNLSILNKYTSNPSGGTDILYSGSVNPLDGKIWLVGSVDYNNPLKRSGRLEVLDQSFSLIGTLSLGIQSTRPQLVFDETGYAYITSPQSDIIFDGGLVKVSPELKIVKTNGDIKADKIVYNDQYLYLVRSLRIDNYWRHTVIRATKDLKVVEEIVLSKLINTDSYFLPHGKMVLVNNKLFVVGIDYALGNYVSRWVVYSVSTAPLLSKVIFEIKNIPGSNLPSQGGALILMVYDAKWNYVTSTEVKYKGGEAFAQFNVSLPYGEYNVEVYHKLSDEKIKEKEMWGQYYVVVDKPQANFRFQRFFSVINQFDYSIQGDSVTIYLRLYYPGLTTSPWNSQPYFMSIILDDDLGPPYIKIANSTTKNLKNGETYDYTMRFTNIPPRTYYLLAISYWHNPWTNKEVITDVQYKVISIQPSPTSAPTSTSSPTPTLTSTPTSIETQTKTKIYTITTPRTTTENTTTKTSLPASTQTDWTNITNLALILLIVVVVGILIGIIIKKK
jgi:hypothetical protein